MLNLDDEARRSEPWWETLYPAVEAECPEDCRPAVRVRFQPIGRIALRGARAAAAKVYAAADLPDDPKAVLPMAVIEAAGDVMSEALLMAGIVDWEGVGEQDMPVPVTPERLALFLANPAHFEKCDALYVQPLSLIHI